VGIGRHGNILSGGYFRVAVRQQVYGYAAPEIAEVRELVPPQIPIEQHAMHEQGRRTAAVLDVADASGWSFDLVLASEEIFATHDFLLGLASRSFCAHSSQQTSTTRVPILTLMAVASSLQSQAAQVFSVMNISLGSPPIGHP
jgi:hypothetical protein